VSGRTTNQGTPGPGWSTTGPPFRLPDGSVPGPTGPGTVMNVPTATGAAPGCPAGRCRPGRSAC
jgi:hypothetical protein